MEAVWRAKISFHYPDEFYYFEPGETAGLSSAEISRAYLRSRTPQALADLRGRLPASYKLNRLIHDKVFTPDSPGFRAGSAIAAATENRGAARQALHAAEQVFKILSFDCRDCGDCSLPDIAYLCPESQCAKNQRNGPCGGTREGKCEVGEKDCIGWRLRSSESVWRGSQHAGRPRRLQGNALKGTSASANTSLKRDHHFEERVIRMSWLTAEFHRYRRERAHHWRRPANGKLTTTAPDGSEAVVLPAGAERPAS